MTTVVAFPKPPEPEPDDPIPSQLRSCCSTVVCFFLHLVTGVLCFGMILGSALCFGWMAHWLHVGQFSGFLVRVVHTLESVVVVLDAVLFLVFLGRSAWHTGMAIWNPRGP